MFNFYYCNTFVFCYCDSGASGVGSKIGGTEVKTDCLTLYNQDLHQVQAKPSMIMKLKKADLLVRVGMGLDDWLDALIANASNSSLFDQGLIDLSVGITK